MIVRIVRMTFSPTTVEVFLERFDAAAPKIRSVSGCERLALWRDADAPAVCTTHSHWASPTALSAYRQSDLFRDTWDRVKPLFADRPEAHSYRVARPAHAITEAAHASS
jgi:quinol monooxygenase YgiN